MASPYGMDRIAADAFLAAIQTQTHDRAPNPVVYRDGDDLRDIQFVGQVDILAAMRAAILAMRGSDEDMEEAGRRYVDGAQHVAVDGIWSTMIDAILADGH
jgi:hypothetical protein